MAGTGQRPPGVRTLDELAAAGNPIDFAATRRNLLTDGTIRTGATIRPATDAWTNSVETSR